MIRKFIDKIKYIIQIFKQINWSTHNIKLWYIFLVMIGFLTMIFIYLQNIYGIATTNKKLPSKDYAKKEVAIRGNIITKDRFDIAKSVQVYKAMIDTRFLDPDKKELFISLFSIYSNIDQQIIREKLDNQKRKGKLVLSYNIDSRVSSYLEQLSSKLMDLGVFIPLNKTGSFIIGLDLVISGDKRTYQYKDTLTPLVGYIKKYEEKTGITRIKGVKGIENSYNKELNSFQNGLKKGPRDVVGTILFNKESDITPRVDGKTIQLTIDLKLQRNIEYLLDIYKDKFEAKEIIGSIMDSYTGEMITFASSNRYDPKNILKNQVPYLNITAIEESHEYGSVLKPIAMALVLDKNRAKTDELLDAYNESKKNSKGYYKKGRFKLDRHYIRDDHQFKKRYITPYDTIIYSSNIGILQLAQRLTAKEFLDGYHSFTFGKKTNIDLPYEKRGLLHTLRQYQAYENQNRPNVYKATDSYGQGMRATFIQLLTAYSTFNNDGKIVTPYVVSNILDPYNSKNNTKTKRTPPKQIIKPTTANIIKDMLIQTVKEGTGKNTDIENLQIGGKTGTAQIAKKGRYARDYISSFFGFANDQYNNRYTIGVSVFEPSWRYHYASSSAAVVFRDIVNTMSKQGRLVKE